MNNSIYMRTQNYSGKVDDYSQKIEPQKPNIHDPDREKRRDEINKIHDGNNNVELFQSYIKDMEEHLADILSEDTSDYQKLYRIPPSEPAMQAHVRNYNLVHRIEESYKSQSRAVTLDIEDSDLKSYLGNGFPLYFYFKKLIIILLAVLILFCGVSQFVFNFYGGRFCNKTQVRIRQSQCALTLYNRLSIVNIKGDPTLEERENYISLLSTIILAVGLLVIRYQLEEQDLMLHKSPQGMSSYTILVKNIPKRIYNENYQILLANYFENNLQHQGFVKVEQINLIYDFGEKEKYEAELKQSNALFQEFLVDHKFDAMRMSEWVAKDEGVKFKFDDRNSLINILHKVDDKMKENEDMYFSGSAFVTFSLVEEANEVKSRFSGYFWENQPPKLKTADLHVLEAPEPNDVNWKYIWKSESQKRNHKFISNIVFLLLLMFCFMIIMYISYRKFVLMLSANSTNNDSNRAAEQIKLKKSLNLQGILCGVVIFVVNNFIVRTVSSFLSDYEQRDSISQVDFTQSRKNLVAIFINTGCITIVSEIIFLHDLYDFGGFINSQTSVFLTDLVLFVFFQLIKPESLKQWFQQTCVPSIWPWKGPAYLTFHTLTQAEYNVIHQEPEFQLGAKYSAVISVVWYTCLYQSVIPIILLISIVKLFFGYWLEKYDLLRRSCVSVSYSSQITFRMFNLLKYALLINVIGSGYFNYRIFQQAGQILIIQIIICLAFFIVPMKKLVYYFLSEQNESVKVWRQGKSDKHVFYHQVQNSFPSIYEKENPVTQSKK